MKTTHALLAFFFFSATLFAAITTAEIVRDSHGDLLNNGGNYYLLPPKYGGNSIKGIVADRKSDGSCTLAVILNVTYTKGWLTNIASPNLPVYITTDLPLWLSFAHLPLGSCAKDFKWLVTPLLGSEDEPIMVGEASDFHPAPLSGWFYIKPYDSAKFHYKLVFCHAQDKCGHVGVKKFSNGNKRLVVTENENIAPLVLKFVKEFANDISMVV